MNSKKKGYEEQKQDIQGSHNTYIAQKERLQKEIVLSNKKRDGFLRSQEEIINNTVILEEIKNQMIAIINQNIKDIEQNKRDQQKKIRDLYISFQKWRGVNQTTDQAFKEMITALSNENYKDDLLYKQISQTEDPKAQELVEKILKRTITQSEYLSSLYSPDPVVANENTSYEIKDKILNGVLTQENEEYKRELTRIDIENILDIPHAPLVKKQVQEEYSNGLERILKNSKDAWPRQRDGWAAIQTMIKRKINRGTIILPCSSGKTRIVAECLKMNKETKLYLLPKNVIGISVIDDFIKWGIPRENIIDCSNGTAAEKLNNLDIGNIENKTIIANYRGLISLRKNNKDLFDQLIEKVKMIFSDEAHRSLGAETRAAVDECVEFEGLVTESEGVTQQGKLHILFTATPRLLFKEVSDYYPYTALSKTMEDIVIESQESGIESPVILPTFRRIGEVYLTLDKDVHRIKKSIDESFFIKHANEVKIFVDREGTPLEERMYNEFLELQKNNGGYLPALGICNTIEQAQKFATYFTNKGIPARRCTGPNKEFSLDLTYTELKPFIDKGGVVFTVDAVAEGVNIPSLRAILECAYTGSPARAVQGVGRSTRSVSEKELSHLKKINPTIEEKFLKKTNQNTVCIGPTIWWGDYTPQITQNPGTGTKKTPREWAICKKVPLKSFYDFILDSGEIGYDTICREGDLETGEVFIDTRNKDVHGKYQMPDMWGLLKKDMRKYSKDPLSQEEEQALFERIKAGDEKSRELIIQHNSRFLVERVQRMYHVRYKYRNPHTQVTINDFFSEGYMGMVKAIDKYNPRRGIRFIGLAVFYIESAIKSMLLQEDSGTLIGKRDIFRIPSNQVQRYNTYKKHVHEYETSIENYIEVGAPSPYIHQTKDEYISEHFSSKEIELFTTMDSFPKEISDIESVDTLYEEDKPDKQQIQESCRREIRRSLNTLCERELQVINNFYGLLLKQERNYFIPEDTRTVHGRRNKEIDDRLEEIQYYGIQTLEEIQLFLTGKVDLEQIEEYIQDQEMLIFLGTLTSEEKKRIIEHKLGVERSLEETGKIMGMSRERMRQVREHGLKRLKKTSRNKLLRQYLCDPEIDGVADLTGAQSTVGQSVGQGVIQGGKTIFFTSYNIESPYAEIKKVVQNIISEQDDSIIVQEMKKIQDICFQANISEEDQEAIFFIINVKKLRKEIRKELDEITNSSQ